MFEKKSRIILKLLNSKPKFRGGSDALLELLSKRDREKHFPTRDDLDATLWYLERKEYLRCLNADNSIYSITQTYESKNYKQFTVLEIQSFLLKSIVVPIGVSFFVALLTASLLAPK